MRINEARNKKITPPIPSKSEEATSRSLYARRLNDALRERFIMVLFYSKPAKNAIIMQMKRLLKNKEKILKLIVVVSSVLLIATSLAAPLLYLQ